MSTVTADTQHSAVSPALPEAHWADVCSAEKLEERGSLIVKVGRKQILLLQTDKGLFACNNRCPHEGYPLKEGTLSQSCILTCNWHNWKFDLESGETLTGGDRLRRYPIEVRDGRIWLDVSDPPSSELIAKALGNLKDCFRRNRTESGIEYDRMAREVARLELAGGNPSDAVRAAIDWTHDRFEFGATHAMGAASDWLTLGADLARDEDEALAPILEVIGHLAWDSRLKPAFPFTQEVAIFDAETLFKAIEEEDEDWAVAQLRGFLSSGEDLSQLDRPLARAALAHYSDFGHSAIYVVKIQDLVARLGSSAAEPLLLALVRQLTYAFREDLIPEFRDYAPTLDAWRTQGSKGGAVAPKASDFRDLSARQAMAKCLEFKDNPHGLYNALLGASAWNLLHFDRRVEQRSDNNVDDNVGWLSFTHAITFANAVRILCERHPDLWPQALLQMACFVGRNNGYVDGDQDLSEWQVPDPAVFFEAEGRALFDHGQFEYIVAAHLAKVLGAVRQEVEGNPDASWVGDLTASVNRFFHTPIKRKHVIRTMRQSRKFVALEG